VHACEDGVNDEEDRVERLSKRASTRVHVLARARGWNDTVCDLLCAACDSEFRNPFAFRCPWCDFPDLTLGSFSASHPIFHTLPTTVKNPWWLLRDSNLTFTAILYVAIRSSKDPG
jgi:hypothetical protein